MGWGSLPVAVGSFWGKSTWGLHKLTVGWLGKIPKVGKGRGWGRNQCGELKEKGVKGAGHV